MCNDFMTYRYVTRDETIYYYNVCVHVVRVPVCNRDCIRQIFPPDVPAPQLRYSRMAETVQKVLVSRHELLGRTDRG